MSSTMRHLEVIVVGLGAIGSATTYHLARSGSAVLGLDRFSPPHAQGSSHGDTRITRLAVGEGTAYVPFAVRSHELWRELEAEAGVALLRDIGVLIMSPEGITAGMHGTDDFLAETLALARRHGIAHDVLAHDDLVEQYPQFDFERRYRGYYEPGAGYVRVDDAVRAQLDLAERHGATIRTGEQVLSIQPSAQGVDVETDRGRYGADSAVVSAGAGLPQLVKPDLARLFTVYRQVQAWFGVRDDAASGFAPESCPVFIYQFGANPEDVFYGFPAIDGPDGGVKIGTETYGNPTDLENMRREVDDTEVAGIYQRCLRGRLPGLSPDARRSITCLYTMTPDFGFVIDRHPEHENVILASPCSGHGFKHSAAIGETLAQLATTGTSTLDVGPFSISRFLPTNPH